MPHPDLGIEVRHTQCHYQHTSVERVPDSSSASSEGSSSASSEDSSSASSEGSSSASSKGSSSASSEGSSSASSEGSSSASSERCTQNKVGEFSQTIVANEYPLYSLENLPTFCYSTE